MNTADFSFFGGRGWRYDRGAAVGIEILENSMAETEQFAKDYVDCEGKDVDKIA